MDPRINIISDRVHDFLSSLLADRRKTLFLGIFASFLLHLPFLGLPPQSSHVWRQTNTLAVAVNFSEESMDILRPRVNLREDGDGVTGMQFPSYEWGLAWCFKAFGQGYWVHHLYSLLILFIGGISR
jgi:hypothetical protein